MPVQQKEGGGEGVGGSKPTLAMLRLVQDAKYPVKCKVKTNKKDGRLSFYYIFSQSHRLPAEFDAGFCFHDGKNLESFAGVLIGLLKYSQLALLKTTIILIPITLHPRNLYFCFVLF